MHRRLPAWVRRYKHFVTVALLLGVLVAVFFWQRIFILVRAGEAGVLWNRFSGTQIDRIHREGLHIVSPLDRMTVYEVRKQIALHELAVLSIEGLRLQLDLAIRYRPQYDLLGMLHERVGPDYLTRVVIPQTESVLRKELGNATAEQIYTDANGLLTRALLKAMDEVGRNFVEVEEIIIRRVQLPDRVREAIEHKLVQQQILESYAFRRTTAEREAERKRIEAGGIRDYQAIVDSTLTDDLLKREGIDATRAIAGSANSKAVVIGAGGSLAFPIMLGDYRQSAASASAHGAAPPPERAAEAGGRSDGR